MNDKPLALLDVPMLPARSCSECIRERREKEARK